MKPNPLFPDQSHACWAHVRSASQSVGYSARGEDAVLVPTLDQLVGVMKKLGLRSDQLAGGERQSTPLGDLLLAYFKHRADVLNDEARHLLMDVGEAREAYEAVVAEHQPPANLLPMNKQKGFKRKPAYLTGIVNTLVWANAKPRTFAPDPRLLTTFTRDGVPLRTTARRVDGAFPSIVNPLAVWEIKEHYHTTTFGSRVSGAVYETLLDGLELKEMRDEEGVDVRHYLILDARYTWWDCGRSYLCRMVDMLHMGLVDEVLFGREVLTRLPVLVREWADALPAEQPDTS